MDFSTYHVKKKTDLTSQYCSLLKPIVNLVCGGKLFQQLYIKATNSTNSNLFVAKSLIFWGHGLLVNFSAFNAVVTISFFLTLAKNDFKEQTQKWRKIVSIINITLCLSAFRNQIIIKQFFLNLSSTFSAMPKFNLLFARNLEGQKLVFE